MPSVLDIVRSESHDLTVNAQTRSDVARTIKAYQRIVQMVATISVTHWPEIQALPSIEWQGFVENLIHPTALNPDVKYPMVHRALGKMPSYLRRAAITTGTGAAASFLSNYDNWLKEPALSQSALNDVKRKEWVKGQQEAVKDLRDNARA
jgi:putative transposase